MNSEITDSKIENLLARSRAITFLRRIPVKTGMLLTVDKNMVRDLLMLNVKNRVESPSEQKKLVEEMNTGCFKVNGDTISYDINYDQINGQTRCRAFLLSDLETIEFMFVTGLDVDAITTIDKGRRRTPEHDYQMAKIKQASKLPSVVKLIIGYKTGVFTAKKTIKSSMSLAFEHQNDEKLQIAATKGSHWYGRDSTKATQTILSACYFLFAEKSEIHADSFFESLISGINLYEGSPVLALSKYLVKEKSHLRHESTKNVIRGINHIIHAWNKYRENQNLKVFKGIEGDFFLEIK